MKDNYISTIPSHLIPFHLPDNWKWFRWADLMISYQQGLIRSNRELGEGNVEYLKMGDLNGDGTARFDILSRAYANNNEIDQFSLKEGDFLINVRNSKELVGKTCITQELNKGPVLFNHMLVRIDHGNKDLNYFINAFLNIPSSRKLLDRIKQGTTTVIALYQRDLNDIPIALPDLKTFNEVVSLYKNILQKISLNNRINAELEAMAKTIYDYWFVQFDFPDKKGKPYKASGGKMVWSEELKREIPVGWKAGTLSETSDLVRGVSYRANDIRDKNEKDVVPILRATNISGNVIDLQNMVYVPSEFVSDKQILDKFDILITMSSGSKDHIGKNGFYFFDEHVAFGAFCAKMVAKENYRYYLYSYTQSDFMFATIKNESLGTNINNLNGTMVAGFKLVIPPKELIEKFNLKVESVFEKIGLNIRENQKLTELRDWLLPMLMNGQIKIKDAEGLSSKALAKDEESSFAIATEDKLAMAAEPETNYRKKK